MSTSTTEQFDARAIRRRWGTQFRPDWRIYWFDMLVSALLGWGSMIVAADPGSGVVTVCVSQIIAILACYRAVLFIHELAHLRKDDLPGFETAWNLIVGFPLMAPSLLYVGSHGEHHRTAVFGTDGDPEYQPIASWSTLRIFASLFPFLLVPVLLFLRWTVLGPLSYLVPQLRPFTVGYVSTLAINPNYKRRMPIGVTARRWAWQEFGAGLLGWIALAALWFGVLSPRLLLVWYVTEVGLSLLNHIRTLAAHRYNNTGERLELVDQYLDSINLGRGSILSALGAPVGLRFHALHHLIPTLPYHSLGRVDRFLRDSSAKETYVRADERNILSSVRKLVLKKEKDEGACVRSGVLTK